MTVEVKLSAKQQRAYELDLLGNALRWIMVRDNTELFKMIWTKASATYAESEILNAFLSAINR